MFVLPPKADIGPESSILFALDVRVADNATVLVAPSVHKIAVKWQVVSALGQKRTLLYALRRLCGQPNAARRMDKPA